MDAQNTFIDLDPLILAVLAGLFVMLMVIWRQLALWHELEAAANEEFVDEMNARLHKMRVAFADMSALLAQPTPPPDDPSITSVDMVVAILEAATKLAHPYVDQPIDPRAAIDPTAYPDIDPYAVPGRDPEPDDYTDPLADAALDNLGGFLAGSKNVFTEEMLKGASGPAAGSPGVFTLPYGPDPADPPSPFGE